MKLAKLIDDPRVVEVHDERKYGRGLTVILNKHTPHLFIEPSVVKAVNRLNECEPCRCFSCTE